ncbi:MAG: hypothetical protein DWQ01_00405 [Planctomycetota bacterium]|nr:MAG: hypothetical protein DWQ01_00405 [Planctomycetota bacterium]
MVNSNLDPIEGARLRLAKELEIGCHVADENSFPWDRAERLGARVECETETDSKGLAFLVGFESHRKLILGIEKRGYARVSHCIATPSPGEVQNFGDVILSPGIEVEVQVRNLKGEVVPDRWIRLVVPNPEGWPETKLAMQNGFEALSDEGGMAKFSCVPKAADGRYILPEYLLGQYRNSKSSAEKVEIELVLLEDQWVEGRFVNREGGPISGAEIYLTLEANSVQPSRLKSKESEPIRIPALSAYGREEWSLPRSEIISDEDGYFKIGGVRYDQPFAVKAVLPSEFSLISRWYQPGEPVLLVAPVMYQLSGRIQRQERSDWSEWRLTFHRRGPRAREELEAEWKGEFSEFNTAKCDASGEFQKWLMPGEYDLEVQGPGIRWRREEKILIPQDTNLGTLRLATKPSASILARCKATGKPVQGLTAARNRLESNGSGAGRSSRAVAGHIVGSKAIWYAGPEGKHRYRLQAPGFLSAFVDVEGSSRSDSFEEVLELEPAGRAVISLRKPVLGLSLETRTRLTPKPGIELHPQHRRRLEASMFYSPEVEQTLHPDGSFRFQGLIPGVYEIRLLCPGGGADGGKLGLPSPWIGPLLSEIEVESGKVARVEISLESMAFLEVRAVEFGKPMEGVEIAIMGSSKSSPSKDYVEKRGETRENGRFVFGPLIPGKEYWVGGRKLRDSSLGWPDPWTQIPVTVKAGLNRLELPLPQGSVEFEIALTGYWAHWVDLAKEPDSGPGTIPKEPSHFDRWIIENRVWKGRIFPRSSYRIEQLPNGIYRLRIQNRNGPAWISPPLEIQGGHCHLGKIQLNPSIQ